MPNTDNLNKIIEIVDLKVILRDKIILEKVNLCLYKKEILSVIGPSGSGKSVLMRTILGLEKKTSGKIQILGKNVDLLDETEYKDIRSHFGVLFQQGALFSSLSVLDNIKVPINEFLDLPGEVVDELAKIKLALVGLDNGVYNKMPAEISGGMIKRVALARALALDPDIIFLDEPTSGLDPISAAQFDKLVVDLKKTIGLSFFMITHDISSLFNVSDRIAVIGDKTIKLVGDIAQVKKSTLPWVKAYINRDTDLDSEN